KRRAMFEPMRPTPTNPIFSDINNRVLIVLFELRTPALFRRPGTARNLSGDSNQTRRSEHAFSPIEIKTATRKSHRLVMGCDIAAVPAKTLLRQAGAF